MRNSKDAYKPLEKLFGTFGPGNAFGESCMFGSESTALAEKHKFYTAIALTESYYLTIDLRKYRRVMEQQEL